MNKKRGVKDAPRSDGDHFKCDTFAELQERLDCIDGSEGPTTFSVESKTVQAVGLRTQSGATKPIEATSLPISKSTQMTCSNKPDQEQYKVLSTRGFKETSKRTSADGEKLTSPFQPCVSNPMGSFPQDSDPVVREKVYLRGGMPKPFGEVAGRTSPVGMSQQAPATEIVQPTSRALGEVNNLRAALFGRCLDRDFLRTTITLQQPVELNGEDELVFTVVEELPHGLVPNNGRPSNLLSFNTNWQTSSSGSRPVSIISSINDEYDAYTTQQGAVVEDVGSNRQEIFQPDILQPGNLWPSDKSAHPENEDSDSKGQLYFGDKNTSLSTFHKQAFMQQGISDPNTPLKPSFTKCPSTSKSSPKGSLKARGSTLNTSALISHRTGHSSLPRKTKPTSSVSSSTHDDFLHQERRNFDAREAEFLSAGKSPRGSISSVSSKRPGGNSNSVPRPPKAQASSAQRIVDGCEKTSSRRADTLIKLPRLTRGATTLGTVSTPEGASVTGTLRFSSLGKKSNVQKGSTISKSGSGNDSPTAQLVRQSGQEQKTRTALSPSALKTSSDLGKSSFPKTSTSVEEFTMRLRAESFSHRTLSLKTEHGFARASSSLKTRGAKAESSRYYGSLMSLERCETLAGSKPELFKENNGATSGGNNRSNRSVPRLGVPASTSQSMSSSLSSPSGTASMSKLGQVKGNGSLRGATFGGAKVRTLSASSTKSLCSSPKPPDNETGHNASLPPSGKSPARSGAGAKMGRGTVMGTKQAISRAANNRVSELATGSQRKPLSRGPGPSENDGTDSGTSSTSGSPNNTSLPSPYSKITAPRRPQRYSSGHGSDNSSILSGELPPAMGRTALFYHSGGSSGYESMIRDSETTGSTSSAHDSMSESGVSLSNRSRVSKSPKKRGNGEFLYKDTKMTQIMTYLRFHREILSLIIEWRHQLYQQLKPLSL